MHKITIHFTTYSIPSQWDELSAVQLRRIAWLTSLKKDGLALTKLFFFILTLHLPFWKRLRLQWFYLVQATTDERGDFISLVESFRQKPRHISQKLKKVRVRTVLLYGPDSGLANCTFFEFIQAERYFINYMEVHANKSKIPNPKSEIEWLDRLIATLYRPRDTTKPKTADDIRIPLTDVGTRYRLAIVRRMDTDTKLAILMWFDGCRQQIIQSFPTIFPKPEVAQESSPLAKLQQQSKKGGSWIDMISELAGSPADYERIGNTNIFTALTDISFRIRKAKEAEQRHAAAMRKSKR